MDLLPGLAPFEPAVAAAPAFSLRAALEKQGVPQANLSSALNTAHAIISTVPGVNIRRYRAAFPMSGITSG